MTRSAGLVIALLRDLRPSEVKAISVRALDLTPPGRMAAFCWVVPPINATQPAVEGVLTAGVLGEPEDRGEDKSADPWLFYSHIAVRHYPAEPGPSPTATSVALVFRRQGDPPYRRLRDGSQPPEDDRLPSRHPAFTRDVANNTWTLLDDKPLTRVASRLTALLSWSDEPTVLLDSQPVASKTLNRDLGLDLIPVAQKTHYEWSAVSSSPGQTSFAID